MCTMDCLGLMQKIQERQFIKPEDLRNTPGLRGVIRGGCVAWNGRFHGGHIRGAPSAPQALDTEIWFGICLKLGYF